jgi:hypothetical protein
VFAYRRRAVVDGYCLQHPAYIPSVKAPVAHLCGLCAAIERPDDPRADDAIWSSPRVPPRAVKPPMPAPTWSVTVADVHHANNGETFRRAADAWIADVWAAWREHHDVARQWLDYSVAAQRGARR